MIVNILESIVILQSIEGTAQEKHHDNGNAIYWHLIFGSTQTLQNITEQTQMIYT